MGGQSPFANCQPILQLCTATGFATKSAMVTRDTQYEGTDLFQEEVKLIEVQPISSKKLPRGSEFDMYFLLLPAGMCLLPDMESLGSGKHTIFWILSRFTEFSRSHLGKGFCSLARAGHFCVKKTRPEEILVSQKVTSEVADF